MSKLGKLKDDEQRAMLYGCWGVRMPWAVLKKNVQNGKTCVILSANLSI